MLFAPKLKAASYYWVGGTGNWSDYNSHWRTTSGGTTKYNTPPTPTDDVFFDANSGFTTASKTVFIDIALPQCKNITTSGASVPPFLSGSGKTLNVYGSIDIQAGTTINLGSMTFVNNNTARTIKTNGVNIGSVTFSESTSITLLDNSTIGGITHTLGTFNTNGFNLTIVSSYTASGTSSKTLSLGSSQVYFTSASSTLTSTPANTTISAGTSTIHFTAGNTQNSANGIVALAGQKFNNVIFEDTNMSGQAISGGTDANPIIFNSLEMRGGGYINGSCKFSQLILASSKNYYLFAGRTQVVTSALTFNTAACTGWGGLLSTTDGAKATLAMSGATVGVSGAFIKDITATGGPFSVNNCVDGTNNSGWTFVAPTAKTLYWVGGAGNWNDTNHWSQTSGGPGGYCIPGPIDDVFFDAGSGFTDSDYTVVLNSVAYCHNITVNGTSTKPTFTSSISANQLNIFGSSEWESGMIYNVYTTNYRSTGEAKTIKSNGVVTSTNGYVYFYESNSISLLDDYSVGRLVQYTGTWNTNNHRVDIAIDYAATGTLTKTINLGSSHIYLNNAFSAFRTNTANTTVAAGTSTIHFTQAMTSSSSTYGVYGNPGQQFYDVVFENPGMTGCAIAGGSSGNPLQFHNVELKGGGYIYGSNKFNQLILAPTKTFYFNSSNTQTITSLLSINTPSCAGWTSLQSTTTTAATISMPLGSTAIISGVIIKDITATGTAAPLTASNSVDNGNNTGLTFPVGGGKNLYWVGGSGNWNDQSHWSDTSGGVGGYCIPGPADNVFFDAGSGFSAGNVTTTVDANSYCHNITVDGTTQNMVLTSNVTTVALNIYGSSVWQSGMTYNVYSTNYRNTGEAKTIKSNGVATAGTRANSAVSFYETSTIQLLDNFNTYVLYQYAGTFKTNNYQLDFFNGFYTSSALNKTVDFGSSVINVNGYSAPTINLSASGTTVLTNTSEITFTDVTSTGSMFIIRGGQTFNNVTFKSKYSTTLTCSTGTAQFNKVEFTNGDGYITGNNNYKELALLGTTYYFGAGNTQTITTKLTASGNSCFAKTLKSMTAGTRAIIDVQGGSTEFNFDNVQDINATHPLSFGAQSSDNGNNLNVTFTDRSTQFNGLGNDWLCHVIDSDPNTYTLSTTKFFGNSGSTYTWRKLNTSTSIYDVIKTGGVEASSLDIRPFGYGRYSVEVFIPNLYGNCTMSDTINIIKKTDMPTANGNVCQKPSNTLADVTVSGQNIIWYSDASTSSTLPTSTPITDGTTYFVTQTIGSCESDRKSVTVKISPCNAPSMINPALPLRTK